uniref:hypothetical protein n=1 Tax=Fusobacterium nucleatum TaxID=851 RepID=UPI0030CE169B
MNNDLIKLNDVDILEFAKPIKDNMDLLLSNIKDKLLVASPFIQMINEYFPNRTLQAVLTNDQKQKIANGILEIMSSKNGENLVAALRDPKTKKIVANIPLQEVDLGPDFYKAITDCTLQFQLLQISAEIKSIQKAVEEVRRGQENDRLATAYSCQQKFLHTMLFKDSELRRNSLLRVALDAEDSRNHLMASYKENIEFIKSLPESNLKKFFSFTSSSKIASRMNELRESFSAITMVSFIEASVYHMLDETKSEYQSLIYYNDFIKNTYLEDSNFLLKLNSNDSHSDDYWINHIPSIQNKMKKQKELCYQRLNLLEVK